RLRGGQAAECTSVVAHSFDWKKALRVCPKIKIKALFFHIGYHSKFDRINERFRPISLYFSVMRQMPLLYLAVFTALLSFHQFSKNESYLQTTFPERTFFAGSSCNCSSTFMSGSPGAKIKSIEINPDLHFFKISTADKSKIVSFPVKTVHGYCKKIVPNWDQKVGANF